MTWTYSFQSMIRIARPLLARVVEDTWAGCMRLVLATMGDEAERPAKPTGAATLRLSRVCASY